MPPSPVEMTPPAQGSSPAVQIVPGRSPATSEGPSFAQVLEDVDAGADMRQKLSAGEMHPESEAAGAQAEVDPDAAVVPDEAMVSEATIPQVLRAFARAQGLGDSTVTRVFAPAQDGPTTPAGSPVAADEVLPAPPSPPLMTEATTGEAPEAAISTAIEASPQRSHAPGEIRVETPSPVTLPSPSPSPSPSAAVEGGDDPLDIAHTALARQHTPPVAPSAQGPALPQATHTAHVINASSPHVTASTDADPGVQPVSAIQAGDDRRTRDAHSPIQVDAMQDTLDPAGAVAGMARAMRLANPTHAVNANDAALPEARPPTGASPDSQPASGLRAVAGVTLLDDGIPTRVEVLNIPLAPADAASREGTDPLARREYALQVSSQIAELLAERVIARIRQGHWQVRLLLSPARLGFIDVQLEMRRGALEATFTASQASTREVLADNLWRLRDSLSGSGMQVAHMSLAGDTGGGSGGFLTPQRQYSSRAVIPDATLNEPSIIPNSNTPPQGLLDVRV